MQLSSRITGLLGGGSDGWGVFLRARQMIDEGTQVTELTIGEHDIRTAAPVLQDMHRAVWRVAPDMRRSPAPRLCAMPSPRGCRNVPACRRHATMC